MASVIVPWSNAIPKQFKAACLCPICILRNDVDDTHEFIIIAKGNRYEGIEALE